MTELNWTEKKQKILRSSGTNEEYTEKLYKKKFNDADNHNGVITHLEPDILECEGI